MAPIDIDTALGWRGRTVRDRDGDDIGKLGDVYLDGESDMPAWASVRTGLFGRKESLVPLDRVEEDEDGLRVPFAKQEVVDAPTIDPDVALEPEEEDALRRHYAGDSGGDDGEEAVAHGGDAVTAGDPGVRDEDVDVDVDEDQDIDAGDETRERGERGEGGPEVIRSEEELRTGTTPMQPRERVRIRKVLVTDHVKRTVPVRREEVRLETDPPESGRVESSEDLP